MTLSPATYEGANSSNSHKDWKQIHAESSLQKKPGLANTFVTARGTAWADTQTNCIQAPELQNGCDKCVFL